MILFRRVGVAFRHIDDREWLLLALETLGVLAGILIAFELQEWGERRNQAARHHELMDRLLEESESDVASIRDMRDKMAPLIQREQSFAAALGTGRCPPVAEFQAINTFGMMPAMTAPTSVYQELMGAGGLSSIEQKDVRTTIAKFQATLQWSQKQIDYFRSFAISMDPVPNTDPRVEILFQPDAADDPLVSRYDAPALCADRAVRNKIAAAARQHIVFMNYFRNALTDGIAMCVALANSLGRRCLPADGRALTSDELSSATSTLAEIRREGSRH